MSDFVSHAPLRKLNNQDYKTLALSALGGALEFYDFIIFVFFSITISHLFFPQDMPQWLSQVQTFGIFAAGYLIRPFGGIVMAHFGDLFGRKRMFTLSILLMALPTLFIGCLPTYASIGIFAPILLLLMRLCQGLAVGGEVPGAWTFVAEHVPRNKIGLACGILTSGLSLGILLGSLVSTVMNKSLSPAQMVDWGWRIPFIIGGIFGLIAMYLRRWLKETPIFLEIQKRKQQEQSQKLPVVTVLTQYLPQTILSMLLTWVLSAGIMVIMLMTPILLQKQFGYSAIEALQGNILAIIGLIISCTFYGMMMDKFALAKVLLIGCIIAAVMIAIFFGSLDNAQLLFITYPLAGFSVGIVGSFAYFMVKVFPTSVRYSGVSFSFNMAYAIAGGLTPLLISFFSDFVSKMAPAIYVVGLFLLGTLIGLFLLINNNTQKYVAKDIS
ncbi:MULTISPECIES: MFS transporter [unclassified Gilliamella]|uniref:MFS transporter n=1 Tax=unclassified Gilliamella TaxID=2685620 RepID=UPI0022698DFF|nr:MULTISPECIES: MFS transporter [unclassified Gilliamella]MCX8602045.1 MFS transporter [Gilliamella sp. B3722]MCX8608336.1 MFS transporter [Gilliamella sp. B3771]MCX8611315.1 MFS transporter [Gilliamella sp. B3891]MCX8613887.1 MFS transporter [Gilliamella sp. B3773]MCX8616323.1 MFS transporter [Gilliamella sp. B3770]